MKSQGLAVGRVGLSLMLAFSSMVGIAAVVPTKVYAAPSISIVTSKKSTGYKKPVAKKKHIAKRWAAGTNLKVQNHNKKYYKVRAKVKKKNRWVYLKKSNTHKRVASKKVDGVVKKGGATAYSKPATTKANQKSKKIRTYKTGKTLKLTTYSSRWYRSANKVKGKYLYVAKSKIEIPPVKTSPPVTTPPKNPNNCAAWSEYLYQIIGDGCSSHAGHCVPIGSTFPHYFEDGYYWYIDELGILTLGWASKPNESDTWATTGRLAGVARYDLAWDMFEEMNKKRTSENLNALELDNTLSEAAMLRAAELNLFYNHTRPNGKPGSTSQDVVGCIGDQWYNDGIIWITSKASASTPKDAIDAWYSSPEHKAVLMRSYPKETPYPPSTIFSAGVGVFETSSSVGLIIMFSPNCENIRPLNRQAENRTYEIDFGANACTKGHWMNPLSANQECKYCK